MTFVTVRLLLSTPKHSLTHNIPPLSHLRFPREQSRIARAHTELEARRERRIIERRLEATAVRVDLVHRTVAAQGQRGEGRVVRVLVDEQHGAVGVEQAQQERPGVAHVRVWEKQLLSARGFKRVGTRSEYTI